MFRHILLLKFKASAEPFEIEKLNGLFASMPDKVDGVLSFEWGENDSPEGKIKVINIRF